MDASMNTTLVKGTYVVSKIMEVVNWVLCAVLVVGAIFVSVNPLFLASVVDGFSDTVTIYGFAVGLFNEEGVFLNGILQATLVIGAIISSLIAMVFRDIYLIGRLTLGQTTHAKGSTPFQPDNIRMIREIGIFAISVPVVQLVGSIILRLVFGVDADISGFVYMGLVFGIAMLCLSQVFAYGTQLQRDADGLI